MAAGPSRRQTVLVVDDDDDLREALKLIVEEAGYEALPARNGRLALQLVAERSPDIVLLDMMMPEMDGVEVLARLRQRPETAALPVIAATGYPDSLLALFGNDDPYLYYCPKPFDFERVHAALSEAIGDRGGRLAEPDAFAADSVI